MNKYKIYEMNCENDEITEIDMKTPISKLKSRFIKVL